MPLSQLLKTPAAELNAELQLILNVILEGLCGLDSAGNVTFCNDALLKMTGYGADELIGSNLHELLHRSQPKDARPAEGDSAFRGAIDDHEPKHIVGELLWRKDGSSFLAEYEAHPLGWPSAQLAYVVTFQDLTEIQRAKDVLRQSEEKFRRILASIPDVAWTCDRKGRLVYVSPKVEAVLGYTKREICATAELWLGRIHPGDFGVIKRAYAGLFERQLSFDVEYRIRRKDGEWIWVQVRALGTHLENGIPYADGVLTDITRRKNAQAELQSKTAFLEAQANSTIDGILVVDRRGQRLMQNERLAELFHIPPALLADKDDKNLLAYVVTLLKSPASFMERVSYLYDHPDETSRDEIELQDGTMLDRYSAPVVDQNGIYYGRIWTFRDIIERTRNEDTLRQLSMAVEQSPVSVVITDPQGAITYVNRKFTETTGYPPEEVLGKNPRVLRSGHCSADLYRNLWSTISQGREWHGEFCNKKKNGEIYWEAATIRPITNPTGAITHFLALKEDITERRRAEKELLLAQFSLEHASDAIFRMNSEGGIVYVNGKACRSCERSREELLSLTIPEIDPIFTKEAWAAFWEDIKVRGAITLETLHATKQGRVFPVEVTANYLKLDGQEYAYSYVRDLTERRKLEGQLRHAQKLESIGQLAAGIAHEINTPIQFVTDNLTFLRDSWKVSHELLERYRSAIHDGVEILPR